MVKHKYYRDVARTDGACTSSNCRPWRGVDICVATSRSVHRRCSWLGGAAVRGEDAIARVGRSPATFPEGYGQPGEKVACGVSKCLKLAARRLCAQDLSTNNT